MTAFASSPAVPTSAPQLGGCDFVEHPTVPSLAARLFWHEALDSSVLRAWAGLLSGRAALFDVRLFARYATILIDGEAERLSLSDGFHRIRIDVINGTLLAAPTALTFRIADDDHAPAQLRALSQFRAFRRRGVFGQGLHPPERHAQMWTQQLRTLDALEEGASEREIGVALFPTRSTTEWREGGGSLRSAVRRLIRTAQRLAEQDYRRLLR